MITYSSRQAAKKLGITAAALSQYIKLGKVPAPKTVQVGRLKVQSWTEAEVEALRQLLPKIANGRKTRYQKLREKQKTPPRARSTRSTSSLRAGLAPHKKRKPKKK